MRDLEALWAMAKMAAVIYFAFAVGKIVFDVFIKTPRDERRARAVQEADDLRRRESIGKRLGMPPKVSRLIFKAADLLDIVDHSLGAPTQMASCVIDYRKGAPNYALPEAPAVLLIHDRGGVYLMSNGDPHYTNEGWPDGANAAGCDPDRDNRCYETIRALVGKDHFTECLPWAAKIKQQIDAGAQEIIIEISRTSLELMPSWASADEIARSILSARSTV